MRLDEVYRRLLEEQIDYYDRMYTLSSGEENGWTMPLSEARRAFIKERFPILQSPFVEGIPRYHKDESWTWDHLSEGLEGWQFDEMKAISELLSSYASWTPYPHQIDSLLAWQQEQHIVVATGTGSGKTECFLYPMLGQLVREARRAKARNKPMERGVKAIVLYPMNALVADQTVRIRDLFGQLEMANKLMHQGAGRYCQFGMYTGRSPAHGWYAEKSAAGNWNYKKNGPREKVKNITKAYTELEQHHPELWQRLVKDRRIPAKGGRWVASENGTWSSDDVLGVVDGGGEAYEAEDSWSLTGFANGIRGSSKEMTHVGQEGDRELYARYEMHLGGLIQRATNNSEPTEEERRIFEEQTVHLGVPDILVTNYSMLEYTLLRPLEHVFWEDTKRWLYGDVLEGEPPRKLMLVLDEAHLYQGSMGTEVSMLIQRLTSVLSEDDKSPDIQVIITSASLGDSDDLKQQFVADLTGVNPRDVAVPAPARTDRLAPRRWDELTQIDTSAIEALERVVPSKSSLSDEEMSFYRHLNLEEETLAKLEAFHSEGGSVKQLQELRFSIFERHDVFTRLYTALQHPQSLSEELHHLRPNGDKSSPWPLEDLAAAVLGTTNKKAVSVLLDLVAMCRDDTDAPLMPIRGHFFSRGMPRLSVCPRCSSFHKLETLRCDQVADGTVCNSRTYELLYGRSTGVAFLNLWVKRLDNGDGREGLTVNMGRQIAYSGPTEGGAEGRRVGLAAWRCKPEKKQHTHVLDMDKGEIIPNHLFNTAQFNPSRHACVKVSGFVGGGRFDATNLWKDKHGNEQEDFFDRICPETKRDHTRRQARQVSNLETRGNEAFSSLVDGMLQQQEPVSGSEHLPNSGKKCLIFSDSRQQAANVAVELGQLSNHDESRRLLLEMISTDWFKALPSMHKSLSGMYPWFALFAASKGLNPFCGGEYADDRDLFVSAGVNAMASILAARCLKFEGDEITYSTHREEIEELMDTLRPVHGQAFSFGETAFKARKSVVKSYLEAQVPFKQEYSALERQFRDAINEWNRRLSSSMTADEFNQISVLIGREVENLDWDELKQQLSPVHDGLGQKFGEVLQFELFDGAFQHLVDVAIKEWRLPPERLATLCQHALMLAMNQDFMGRSGFIHQWNRFQRGRPLPLHQKEMGRYSESWASFIIKVVNDAEYGIEEIGLGYVQINDEFWRKIPEDSRLALPQMRYLLPRIFSRTFKKTGITGASILSNAMFSESRMPGLNPLSINKNNPFFGEPPGLTEKPDLVEKIHSLIQLQGTFSTFELSEFMGVLDEHSFFTSMDGRIGLNADSVEIIPLFEGSIRICACCYRPRLTPEGDTTKCGACGSEEFLNSAEDVFSQRYANLRVAPWRNKMDAIVNEGKEVFLMRAQEHTAQIGDKLDDSDLYSPAELYELQFQDMPVPDSTSVLGERSSLPPIDVLSCTTTMEVGIDIGSLTCVALRSMPPHSANYQQRIGRAGRGSAEVSVALTWADNSAYAQQLFEQPKRLLNHPDTPPTLYMDNDRIKHRHFQASLLQLFMKRKPYLRDLLIFDGMQDDDGSVTPSMVESLGMVERFFNDDEHAYAFPAFSDWVRNDVNPTFLQQHFSSVGIELGVMEQWRDEFIVNLEAHKLGGRR